MIRKALKKLVFNVKTRWHESGKRTEALAIDHRVDLLRGGSGAPLVYLHSLVGETRWLPFHQGLAEAFEVFAPAHPGFGATEIADPIESMEDVVFHYLDVLEGLGIKRAHFVGVSLGGWIAAEFAVRYPERVTRLVLADAFGLNVEDHPLPDVFSEIENAGELRRLLFADPEGPMADLLVPKKGVDAGKMLPVRDALHATRRLAIGRKLFNEKLARRLRRISCPTMVLWGERDALLPLGYAEAYRDRIANAELKLLPDAGHLPQFEQPERFVQAVKEFL